MSSTQPMKVNRSIRIHPDTGVMTVTKAFAHKNLSKTALKYAEETDKHYIFQWGRNSYIVVYELPQIFDIEFLAIMRFLINYCMPYVKDCDINDDNIHAKYLENKQKAIKY